MPRSSVSVVIPMKNEAGNIGALIDGIDAALADEGEREIIVVDDGSTDASGDEVGRAGRRCRMSG